MLFVLFDVQCLADMLNAVLCVLLLQLLKADNPNLSLQALWLELKQSY